MTDRIVKVVLRGEISQFLGSMKAASSAARSTVNGITDGSKESAKYRQNLTALGTAAGKVGLVAAAGVGLAVRAFANFDQAMSHVAATGKDAEGSIDALREAAIKAGARTVYSATEAANAIEELAKAGVSAKDILAGGLNAALDLAAAGGLAVADAATIAATTLNQFGLSGGKAEHVADLLASAANSAQGSVSDVGEAMKYVGPVAHQMGVSLEETTGTIAELASQGILAGNAGTALRGVLSALTSPSMIASKTMEQLGINVYDAQGNFVGFRGVAEQLHATLGDLTNSERDQALGRIFGNEQITAARILYQGGAADVDKWTKAVDQSGAAQEQAAKRLDNLSGDFEQLKGSLDTALIGTGEGANGPLRETVQLLTGLVNAYNALPGPIKTTLLAGAGLTAALGGSAFVISRAISGYAGLKQNLGEVSGAFDNANKKALAIRGGAAAAGIALAGISGPAHKASDGLGDLVDVAGAAALGFAAGGPWGAAIGGGIALFSALGDGGKQSSVDIAGLTATLDQQTGAITKNTGAWVAKQLQDSGDAAKLKDIGISLATATDAALGNADAIKQVGAAVDGTSISQKLAIASIFGLGKTLKAGAQDTRDFSAATSESSEIQGAAASSATDLGASADSAATSVKGLTDALNGLFDPLLNQDAASNAWKESLASLSAELKKNGGTLDENSLKGLQNQDSIRDRVKALKDSVSADAEAGATSEEMASKLRRGARGIIAAGEAAGFSSGQMRKYLRQLGLAPSQIKTLVKLDSADAVSKLQHVSDRLTSLDGKTVRTYVQVKESTEKAGGGAIHRATGGSVIGAGTGTSDSISASGPGGAQYKLSNGEHVLTASDVNLIGGQDRVYAMRAAIQSRQFAFATGGSVGSSSAPTSTAPLIGRLIDTRVHMDKHGMTRLIDDRFELLQSGQDNYRAAGRRAGRSG